MFAQVLKFNSKKAGTRKGWCLQNVRLGFGIRSKYATAADAWKYTKQHKDRNFPPYLYVPLFYKYETDGHINVLLPNGTVWSDGVTHSSLDSYLRSHPAVSFLGWGESINGVAVLKPAPVTRHYETVKIGTWFVRPSMSFKTIPVGVVLGGQKYDTIVHAGGWRQITYKGKTRFVGAGAWK